MIVDGVLAITIIGITIAVAGDVAYENYLTCRYAIVLCRGRNLCPLFLPSFGGRFGTTTSIAGNLYCSRSLLALDEGRVHTFVAVLFFVIIIII